jgi:hypothetical protein
MPRTALIQLAKQSVFASAIALDLASQITSPDDIQRETATLEKKVARAKKASRWCTRAFICAVVAGFAAALACSADLAEHGDASLAYHWGPFVMLSVLCMLLGSGLGALVVGEDLSSCQSRLQYLQPMDRTEEFLTAHNYLSAGYQDVRAWCELAMSERGTLCAFDMVVLRSLHYGRAETRAQRGRPAVNDPAGRQRFGIEDVDPAGAGEVCA